MVTSAGSALDGGVDGRMDGGVAGLGCRVAGYGRGLADAPEDPEGGFRDAPADGLAPGAVGTAPADAPPVL
ncbi:hypothetical protein GTZ89_38265, partial [Streptomyces sp. SID8382]|nr:hypothetical protein [Streptomyces sp. SID8382]